MSISVIIPAFNEEKRINKTIKTVKKYVDEVIVIDDGSQDKTSQIARSGGAKVIQLKENKGILNAFKIGIKKAKGDIVVKIDADGEQYASDIPRLVKLILTDKADIVLGKRFHIDRTSERFLNWLINFRVKVKDSGSGFKAGKKEILKKLELKGKCNCGIFVLEAHQKGARIKEVPIRLRKINKKRRIAWIHILQFFYVVRLLLKK